MEATVTLAGTVVRVFTDKHGDIAISLDGQDPSHFNWTEAVLISHLIATAVAEVKENSREERPL